MTDDAPDLTSPRITLTPQASGWQPIETAPKEVPILAWCNHNADSYQDPNNPERLTDYATWAEAGDFFEGEGVCVVRWQPAHFEAIDEYGQGYWLPAYWFLNDDCGETVANPTHWMPLPAAPEAQP